MEDTNWVRVFGDKNFHVANSSFNAINTSGGVKSFYTIGVDADRWANENGDSYTDNRFSDAPLHANYTVVANGSFQPIVGGKVQIGHGYITRVKLGMLTDYGPGWAKANLFVGGAESSDHPMANYTFDAYGNASGFNNLDLNSIQAHGSSLPWGSINLSGSKGGYAGIHFNDVGHWFGVDSNGLSGVWNTAGVSKWYFDAAGSLAGGATVPWNIVTNKPARHNWAESDAPNVVSGMLAWRNYGSNHVIFDASAGLSPSNTVVDKTGPQFAWGVNSPTLMGWSGTSTHGVRVDSARRADSAGSADGLAGGIHTNAIG
jgi:hypothetical protein